MRRLLPALTIVSVDSGGDEHVDTHAKYHGVLGFGPIDQAIAERITEIHSMLEVYPASPTVTLIVEYDGRDSARWFVTVLRRLAALVRDADGEISCEYWFGDDPPKYEFYTIREGRLFVQHAELVRGPVVAVDATE